MAHFLDTVNLHSILTVLLLHHLNAKEKIQHKELARYDSVIQIK